jgi:ATP-dependent Clp protease adapter protein ClpS
MQAGFKVELAEAQKFQTVWTKNGLAVLLPSDAAQFATDFANIVLRNFIQMCQEQAQQVTKKEKKLIIEG